MARAILPIPPFPAAINREGFAHYITGFTDGEGCFQLRICRNHKQGQPRPTPSAVFSIGLRADDLPVLQLIQSFFGCGGLVPGKARGHNRHPYMRFQITGVKNLVSVIVPHFDRYYLHAKKARDYEIWKKGVALIHQIASLPRGRSSSGSRGGAIRWTRDRIEYFLSLKKALASAREFNAPILPLPPPLPELPSLFDDLPD